VVLEICWEHVDYLSLHYYAENHENDTASFLAMAAQFESQVDTLAGLLRYVKAKRRSKHEVKLSWDEWNVWYKDRSGRGGWQVGPALSEEIYNLEDALVVAQWLNVFLRKSDVLKIACLAQIVNTISPLTVRGDRLLQQTTYYPLRLVAPVARGVALDVLARSPLYETRRYGPVPVLDVAASYDEAADRGALFVVNRSLTETVTAEVVWQGTAPRQVTEMQQLAGTDPKAANTFEAPDVIVPRAFPGGPVREGRLTLQLPPLSFTVLTTSGYSGA